MCGGGSQPAPPPPPVPAAPAPRAVDIPEPPKMQDDALGRAKGDDLASKRKGTASLRIKRSAVQVAGGTGGGTGVNVPGA